jgi:hypothetical protein
MDADDLLSWLNVIRVCSARARHFDQRLDVLDLKPHRVRERVATTRSRAEGPSPITAMQGQATDEARAEA